MSIKQLIHSHFIFLLVVMVILVIIVIVHRIKNQKRPKELSQEKYNSTLINKLIDVTNSEKAMFNIWPFVSKLKKATIISKKFSENELVYKVYRDANEDFEHIFLNTDEENKYIVIVANLVKTKVNGYFLVDLPNKNYN